MTQKRKAFTLTELLVVVVIIGVLAAVVLPKFTKVIEARKTTEAEALMTAVRTEQEARCNLGKRYQSNLTKLGVYKASKNFTYGDKGGVGMFASAKNYSLEMPSYADGRICCSGDDCADLGKNYPSCDDLVAKVDYVVPNEDCGVEIPPTPNPDPDPDPDPVIPTPDPDIPPSLKCTPGTKEVTSCVCGKEEGRICKEDGSDWETYTDGTCELTQEEKSTCSCSAKPAETEDCDCGGQRTRKVGCWEGLWWFKDWSACEGGQCQECKGTPPAERQCTPNDRKFDGNNKCRIRVTKMEVTQEQNLGGGNIKPTVDILDDSALAKLDEEPNVPIKSYDDWVDYGYTCDDYCKWRKNPCPSYTTGGGGGGGHHGGGGGGGGTANNNEMQLAADTDGSGNCTLYANFDNCHFESHSGDCATMMQMALQLANQDWAGACDG